MHSSLLTAAIFATIMRSVSASPLAQVESDGIVLWNGNENVVTSIDTTGSVPNYVNGTTPSGLERRDNANVDCSGQGLCNTLGGVDGDCADAERRIVSTNIYLTGSNVGSSGVCSGKCGVFVKGKSCQASGTELLAAYKSIRDFGCSDCGVFTRISDSCELKVDKVNFC